MGRKPFNLSLTMRHSQNTLTKRVDLTIPRKILIQEGKNYSINQKTIILSNLGFSYSVNSRTQLVDLTVYYLIILMKILNQE